MVTFPVVLLALFGVFQVSQCQIMAPGDVGCANRIGLANNMAANNVLANNIAANNIGNLANNLNIDNLANNGLVNNIAANTINGLPMAGYGDVSVVGELPVGGSTAVVGNVPVIGYVTFEGTVPAGGVVSVASSCGGNQLFI